MNQLRQSSIEAHELIKPKKETHYQIIIKAMQKIGSPATSKQISFHTIGIDYKNKIHSLTYHEVARRLSEMEKQKEMVQVVGRNPNEAKRPLLWDLTDNYKLEQNLAS